MNPYLCLKYAHILIAILALGTGAAVGILVGFFGEEATHGAFVLRLSRKLLHWVVLPGYALMLVTGMWLGHVADLLDARWTEWAMNAWGAGALMLALMTKSLRRQIKVWETEGPSSPHFHRAALLGRCYGGGAALVILVILGLMVFKPA